MILTVVTFLPLLGAILLLFMRNDTRIKWVAFIFAFVDFLLTIPLLTRFDKTTHLFQFVEKYEWISTLNINYYLGVDGISVLFVFLTALIGWICVLVSWRAIVEKVKAFMICLLVMQTAMIGVFCALDFVLFYLFWEAMLIPMYLLIGVWGGPNRVYSAIKFFIYTLAGSVLMLVGMIALYYAGGGTFEIPLLMEETYGFRFQIVVFVAFFIAFAIKVPMFPFHTWLPDAHVQAPTAGSVILAGILLKMGTYGFIRFSMPMFPDATNYLAMPIVILSIIAIIYGAFLALAQTDMKKLIAYSSVSHMGFVTMGLFLLNRYGVEGGIIQMFNHGITTSALFVCIGFIYERTHTRDISRYGWAARLVPIYAVFLFIFTLASLGFPGTNGFIGEILVLFAAYEVHWAYIVLLLVGILFGAAYMLYLYGRIAFGAGHGHGDTSGDKEFAHISDMNLREIVVLTVLAVFVFYIGFQPMPFLDIMHESVGHLLTQVNGVPAVDMALK